MIRPADQGSLVNTEKQGVRMTMEQDLPDFEAAAINPHMEGGR